MYLLNHAIICQETLATLWQFYEHLFAEGTASSSNFEWRYHSYSSHHSRCLAGKFMMAILFLISLKQSHFCTKSCFITKACRGKGNLLSIYVKQLVFKVELAWFCELWTQTVCEPSNSVTGWRKNTIFWARQNWLVFIWLIWHTNSCLRLFVFINLLHVMLHFHCHLANTWGAFYP